MTHDIPRRSILRGLGIGTAALALGVSSAPRSLGSPAGGGIDSPLLFHSPHVEPFRGAPTSLPTVTGNNISITAVSSSHRFHPDFPEVPALAYHSDSATSGDNVSYLGPTILAHTDDPLALRFANRIGAHPLAVDMDTSLHGVSSRFRTQPPSVLHLHGGQTPPDSDGHPEQLIFPGSDIVHRFPNGQEAAHLWYHDHAMGITRINVYAGLAGMVMLRDRYDTGETDNPLGLPAGDFEMPLVMQEKLLKSGGEQSVRSTPIVLQGSWEGGAVGDIGLVNGAIWPEIPVARGLHRFRMINAASYSVWTVHFENRMRFWVIGNDGGLLDAPVPVTEIRMAPAERYDVLVDFSGFDAGTTVELRNDEAPPFQAALLGAVAMPLFCRFRVGPERGFTGGVPTSLRGGRGPAPLPPLETPTVVRDVSVSQPYAIRNPPAFMALNNLRFTDPDIEMPRAGAVEQWNIVNTTDDPHPIHIHLVMFRILGRQPLRTVQLQAENPRPAIGFRWTPSAEPYLAGPMTPPAPWEAGWKDTVRVDRGTVTRIIVRFPTADELGFDPDAMFARPAQAASQPAVDPGSLDPGSLDLGPLDQGSPPMDHSTMDHGDLQGYVWHCHLLDHEDHEMMLRYRVVE